MAFNIQAYIEDLLENLALVMDPSTRIKLELAIDSFELEVNQALQIGLIINELVINGYKHIEPDISHPKMSIRLNQNGTTNLVVQDNGNGLPSDFKTLSQHSFGLKVVELLTRQLDGTMVVNNNPGTRFEFKFKV